MTNSPGQFYQQRLKDLAAEKQILLQKKNRLAWFRFFSIISAFAAAWQLWSAGPLLAIIVFILLISLFIYFLVQDITNNENIENVNRLLSVNQTEQSIINNHYFDLPDGQEHVQALHPYSNDLDIFGRASLFQYVNRTTSEQGSAVLAHWLMNTASVDEIQQKQEAAKELVGDFLLRQQLQSYGMKDRITTATERKINTWLTEKTKYIHSPLWQLLRILLPLIALSLLALYLSGLISGGQFTPAAVLLMVVAYSISKLVSPAHAQLGKITAELSTLSSSIELIEKAGFTSPYLQQLKTVFDHHPGKASEKIKGLARILERLDYRFNFVVHIPLNTFLFWDLQQLFALEKWREQNRQEISHWFKGLAEMETISTISTLTFNHPEWHFPSFTEEEGVFDSEELGHPLIATEKRISNSFSTKGFSQLNLITGSNMAGKSTFLRSIGVNMVLAMMGAPVCAKRLTLSPMKVMSSMRITDNLEESTSTFYAELKKLKEIIEAVNRKEKVFLLLDEILRGTNSADRHTGSKALIKQLIHHDAAGVLATHDLELAKLADEFPSNIQNYHFDVQVANEELFFDYKLKRGICRSMNASILMKKIGIEL
ncbi:MAG: hypothetical protein JNM19_06690 [Chitinophagaceae bacterium]|nr:hypothetical protein [Chitinophagaceae bacterium]